MIECTTCFNMELLKTILQDKSVWDSAIEDGISKDNFTLPTSSLYFIFVEDKVTIGACSIRPLSTVTAELGVFLLPRARGKSTIIFNLLAIWLLNNTILESLITIIPKINTKSILSAKNSGFIEIGTIPLSYRKNGIISDQILLQVVL